MSEQPTPIMQLATLINALLEQCPPNTRQVLTAQASHLMAQLDDELRQGAENAKALDAIKAEQKEKGTKGRDK